MSVIPPVHLKTKKAKKEYASKLLNSGHTESLKTDRPAHFSFFKEFFNHHPNPEKMKGMIDFAIRANQEFPNSNHMFVIYGNGREEESISYRTVLEPRREHYHLNEAMRNEIECQIAKFRQKSDEQCELCGSTHYLNIDHYDEPFSKLRDDFLTWFKSQNRKVPEWLAKDRAGRPVFDLDIQEHLEFAADWSQYHEYYAKLRVLCRSCNCSLGDYGYRRSKKKT